MPVKEESCCYRVNNKKLENDARGTCVDKSKNWPFLEHGKDLHGGEVLSARMVVRGSLTICRSVMRMSCATRNSPCVLVGARVLVGMGWDGDCI